MSTISWLFKLGNDVYLSTQKIDYGGNTYEARIIPDSFAGVPMNVDIVSHLMVTDDITFEISNPDGGISLSIDVDQ